MGDTEPFGLDLQLALYVGYELHHRGFAGVDPRWEWDPGVLQLRARLEESFGTALREGVGDVSEHKVVDEIRRLFKQRPVLADHLREQGTWPQLREYFAQRSVHRLKTDDSRAWATHAMTPAQSSSATADGSAPHSFAEVLKAAGLDPGYLRYLNDVSAEALALVNMMSMFGLHRNLRGAAAGQMLATKIAVRRASGALVDALVRVAAPAPCVQFYRAHTGPASKARCDTVGALLEREPELESDVVLGIRAFELIEDRFATRLVTCWTEGRTSLRHASW